MDQPTFDQLAEAVASKYEEYQSTKKFTAPSRDVNKLRQLIALAVRYARVLSEDSESSPSLRPKYAYSFDDQELHLGPAFSIVQELDNPEDFTPQECADLFVTLMSETTKRSVDTDMFTLAFDRAQSLLHRFQDFPFENSAQYDQLETAIRAKVLSPETIQNLTSGGQNTELLRLVYEQSLKRAADNYMRVGDYAGAVACLLREVRRDYDQLAFSAANGEYIRLFLLNYYNQLLGILPSEQIAEQVQENYSRLSPNQRREIDLLAHPNISDLKMSDIKVQIDDVPIPEGAGTRMLFVVPHELPVGEYESGGWKIVIESITDPLNDPNFRLFHDQFIRVSGMPLAVLSPALDRSTPSSLVVLITKDSFCPDLRIGRDRIPSSIDRDALRRVFGDDYDPYVAKASELLLGVQSPLWPDLEQVVSAANEIDSFAVQYFTEDDQVHFHFFRPITKLSTFIRARDRFVNRFRQAVQRGSRKEQLGSLLMRPSPSNKSEFASLVLDVFNELIAIPSAESDWWKCVWERRNSPAKVKLETDVHLVIFHIIRPVLVAKGLQVDREVEASGGEIDFLISCAAQNTLLRCGVEVKFAHHAHILSGIGVQLPDYMKDLDADLGVFVVLWCKGEGYDDPNKYADAESLSNTLVGEIPLGLDIRIVVIDSSIKLAPSKRRIVGAHQGFRHR